MQRVFIVERYFRPQSYEAFKQAYQVHFPDAAVPNKATMFWLLDQWRHFVQRFYEYVEMGSVKSTTGWGGGGGSLKISFKNVILTFSIIIFLYV
jgi:hypothetical protein